MPGGTRPPGSMWKRFSPPIAAHVADDEPCCTWIGTGGAGHFVKMVHNGIEYGDMQLICEAYHFMKELLGMDAAAMQPIFANWNKGDLNSYLVEITADIPAYHDADGLRCSTGFSTPPARKVPASGRSMPHLTTAFLCR